MRIFQDELLFANNMYYLNWKKTDLLDGIVVYDDFLNKYYAYGSQDETAYSQGYLRTSDNGINWEDYGRLSGDLFRTSVRCMTAGFYNGARRFVAIGKGYGATITDLYVSTSADFITWTTPTKNSNLSKRQNCYGLAYGNNKFIALLDLNLISTSSNGTSWTALTQLADDNLDANSICFLENKFWITSSSGKVYTSSNGTNWELTTTIINPDNSITWFQLTGFNGFYLANGSSSNLGTCDSISFDLTNWTLPIKSNSYGLFLKTNDKIIGYTNAIKRYVPKFTPQYLIF